MFNAARFLLPLFALVTLSAVPRTAHAGTDQCIFLQSISGWSAINDKALIVYTSPSKAYRVDVQGYCYGLRSTETIAIDSRDGRLCWPSNNHILTSYGGRCLVTSVLPMAKKAKPPSDTQAD